MDRERLSNESYRTGLCKNKQSSESKSPHTQTIFYSLYWLETNSLVVHSACTTCCSLNAHEKDVETSMDLLLDEVGLQNKKLIQLKYIFVV